MKHLMLDIYGTDRRLFGMTETNELLNTVIRELALPAVMPPENIPYYYCAVPEDGGVSSYCILDGGHITVHSFPFFSNCYADILYDDFDKDHAISLFTRLLRAESVNTWFFDRDGGKCGNDYTPESDFGPHLLVSACPEKAPGIAEVYEILDTLPETVGMHPIMRPRVITNKISDFDIVSGMAIIAESHISVHSNIKKNKVYFDLYSCKFCKPEILFSVAEKYFGGENECQLLSRGSKLSHTDAENGYSLIYNGWRENI